jgi:RimJ/RimL family protein N-acetyltransferase
MAQGNFKKTFNDEIAYFESIARQSFVGADSNKYKNVGAIWVLSGSGSYLKKLISSPSDLAFKKYTWYSGTDRKRLNHAKKWLEGYEKAFGRLPYLIYNGTEEQNDDLKKAVQNGDFKFPLGKLFIPKQPIKNTLDQVKYFELPKQIDPQKQSLAILSHSTHLPRILRFMNKYASVFQGIEIVLIPLDAENAKDQTEMMLLEFKNIQNYLKQKKIDLQPYPFKKEVVITEIKESDLLKIYELSNQPSVRAVSFNQSKIKLADHKKWFVKKINDPNVLMLKATIGDELAGQLRLDIEGDRALIGISVSEQFRGQGIAGKLINEVLERAIERKIKLIEAFIKPDNAASINLFEKYGFKYTHQTDQFGERANKYILKLNGN